MHVEEGDAVVIMAAEARMHRPLLGYHTRRDQAIPGAHRPQRPVAVLPPDRLARDVPAG
jgi:hypothetical protein